MVFVCACDLPPIGFGRLDASVPDDTTTRPVVCEPNTRRCVANSVHLCDPTGTDFSVEPCHTGDTCNFGRCEPIANTCDGDQPFALSATDLAFEATRDFKSQSSDLTLRNCADYPLAVRGFEVRGPVRPDGTPVFTADSNPAGLRIEPGGSTTMRLTYWPSPGLSHVTGRVVLGLIASEFVSVEVALRSKAVCVSSTPFIDFGMREVGRTARTSATLQNCGTEEITIDGWSAPDNLEVTLAAPVTLAAGASAVFDVAMATDAPQQVESTIAFQTTPSIEAITRVRGVTVSDECVPMELAPHRVVVDNRNIDPAPGRLVGLRFNDGIERWLDPLRQPQGSYASLHRGGTGWSFRPRVIGRYRSTAYGYDAETGRRSCEWSPITVDVLPSPGLTVELVWRSTPDSIPEDIGFGRSANLDLHVLQSSPGRRQWNDPSADCWPNIGAPCANGTIHISQGGLAEVVHVPNVTGTLQVGVYLSNPFNFRHTLARVRVYRDHELVANLPSTSLTNANDFWLVGQWDEATSTWTDINSVFAGFPH